MKVCFACKKELAVGREVGRRDECPFCHADLHCCLNCRFYDPSAPKQCREPVAENVREKNKANFCDYFQFAEGGATGGGDAAATRKALDDLFKKMMNS
jgi:hypothetical protein